MKIWTAILLCAFVMVATLAWPHGDEIHVMGTVEKVDGTTITVAERNGNHTSVSVTGDTKFLKGTAAAKLEDLKPGDRVVIHAKKVKDQLQATEVKIGIAAKAAAGGERP